MNMKHLRCRCLGGLCIAKTNIHSQLCLSVQQLDSGSHELELIVLIYIMLCCLTQSVASKINLLHTFYPTRKCKVQQKELGTKVLMPRVDYASLQPCCSLWLFVQLELYSALSLDYAVVVAMSCFCMCYAIQ